MTTIATRLGHQAARGECQPSTAEPTTKRSGACPFLSPSAARCITLRTGQPRPEPASPHTTRAAGEAGSICDGTSPDGNRHPPEHVLQQCRPPRFRHDRRLERSASPARRPLGSRLTALHPLRRSGDIWQRHDQRGSASTHPRSIRVRRCGRHTLSPSEPPSSSSTSSTSEAVVVDRELTSFEHCAQGVAGGIGDDPDWPARPKRCAGSVPGAQLTREDLAHGGRTLELRLTRLSCPRAAASAVAISRMFLKRGVGVPLPHDVPVTTTDRRCDPPPRRPGRRWR
ncbi:MAG: hypothetical protein JWP64_4011 [Pseudonocardia sp.]|jgi:hypothetical protein|nr:hypothetical protein [Pseudonocardia sp.]